MRIRRYSSPDIKSVGTEINDNKTDKIRETKANEKQKGNGTMAWVRCHSDE